MCLSISHYSGQRMNVRKLNCSISLSCASRILSVSWFIHVGLWVDVSRFIVQSLSFETLIFESLCPSPFASVGTLGANIYISPQECKPNPGVRTSAETGKPPLQIVRSTDAFLRRSCTVASQCPSCYYFTDSCLHTCVLLDTTARRT